MLWAIKFKKGLMPPLTTIPTSDKIDLPKSALLRLKPTILMQISFHQTFSNTVLPHL